MNVGVRFMCWFPDGEAVGSWLDWIGCGEGQELVKRSMAQKKEKEKEDDICIIIVAIDVTTVWGKKLPRI